MFTKYSEEEGCAKGEIVDELPHVNLTAISGKVACAKRGGPTFLETVRVDLETQECPRTYVPCSTYTTATDTVCVKEYEKDFECPIIDLFIVKDEEIPYLKENGF